MYPFSSSLYHSIIYSIEKSSPYNFSPLKYSSKLSILSSLIKKKNLGLIIFLSHTTFALLHFLIYNSLLYFLTLLAFSLYQLIIYKFLHNFLTSSQQFIASSVGTLHKMFPSLMFSGTTI